ncbi:hypothetical protein V6259_17965 [Marinomonas sp. TI.3.20]|uniref:hypothetical protein n=1 Tax=Marinomonas sp. TI.3.20 TaxID=3121296 RepID=UPI00311E89F2
MNHLSNIFYHGSGELFDKFDLAYVADKNLHNFGIYLTSDIEAADNYRENSAGKYGAVGDYVGALYEVKLLSESKILGSSGHSVSYLDIIALIDALYEQKHPEASQSAYETLVDLIENCFEETGDYCDAYEYAHEILTRHPNLNDFDGIAPGSRTFDELEAFIQELERPEFYDEPTTREVYDFFFSTKERTLLFHKKTGFQGVYITDTPNSKDVLVIWDISAVKIVSTVDPREVELISHEEKLDDYA